MSQPRRTAPTAPASDHDHGRCVDDALARAEAICAGRGARLTELRRRVLQLVWRSHEPVGAYDVLEALGGDGRRAAPPTVYRALEFLIEQGLIHRIESRNAFIGCAIPDAPHSGQFLLCAECGSATELTDSGIEKAVAATATREGFRIRRVTLEVEGLCPRCQAGGRKAVQTH
ncbi:MAG: transcriptional repressor [Proteobacteria bacterium]|nr:transcriptional repressor [Pseudomonadota bacterium]MBI3497526.1 transcriptional repressor [Pseudomonadota bacterium]